MKGRVRAIRLAVCAMTLGALMVQTPAQADHASAPEGLRVRKNVKELTAIERATFVNAIIELKKRPSPYDPTGSLSYYDQFVFWHNEMGRCTPGTHGRHRGHGGPVFLPWHRAYLVLFEEALSEIAGRPVAVPYWDWSDLTSTSSVFAPDFMGGDGDPDHGYAVTTGPFRKGQWKLAVRPEGLAWGSSARSFLTRHFGTGRGLQLPTVDDVSWALGAPNYDVEPYDATSDPNQSFRNAVEGFWTRTPTGMRITPPEIDGMQCDPLGWQMPIPQGMGMHNTIHATVAGIIPPAGEEPVVFGTMNSMASPNDPVFWLNHANIDRLWSKWQDLHGLSYEPAADSHDVMEPFASASAGNFTPASVESWVQLGYTYSAYRDSDDAVVPDARADRDSLTKPKIQEYSCPVRRSV